MQTILKIDPTDNLIVALQDLRKEQRVHWNDEAYVLRSDVKAKHKFATEDIAPGDIVSLYGVPVGKATRPITRGEAITTENIKHYAAPVSLDDVAPYDWQQPDVSAAAADFQRDRARRRPGRHRELLAGHSAGIL